MSAKTAIGETQNIYATALGIRRRPGQALTVVTTNVDATADLNVRVEAAAGPADSFETHDFSVATVIYEATGITAQDLDVLALDAASAVHTNYRVQVQANASGTNGNFSIYAQAGAAVEAD